MMTSENMVDSGAPTPLELRLGGDAEFVRLVPLRRPFPDAESEWDRDVMDMTVEVSLGPFRGAYRTFVWSSELAELRELLAGLERRLGEEVNEDFRLREGTLELSFQLGRRGTLGIAVEAAADPGLGPRLSGAVDADQSYFPRWLRELDALLATFPSAIPPPP